MTELKRRADLIDKAGADDVGRNSGAFGTPSRAATTEAGLTQGAKGKRVHPYDSNVNLDDEDLDRDAEGRIVESFSCISSVKFFCKHSYRDVERRKCHFCLSFCSVFIVVWAALIINTIVEKGPVIFLKLAEGEAG